MKKIPLHWQILLGMAVGLLLGLCAYYFQFQSFVVQWIKPIGNLFINALKALAMPLVMAAMIKGFAEFKDIHTLPKLGSRTIGLYLITTFIAVLTGLILANIIQPGSFISEATQQSLQQNFEPTTTKKEEQSLLDMFIAIVPDNVIGAATDNKNMLQVIAFMVALGIALLAIPKEKAEPVQAFFDGLYEAILKLIDWIMLIAPYGVLALMAALVVESPSLDIFKALLSYGLTVLLGLTILILVVYPLIVWIGSKKSWKTFLSGIAPAQLLAFSTSSSAATLPLTLECVTENLKVKEKVANFVLPIGMTLNMDGTSCYQAIAALFIAQAFGMDLSISQQLGIVLTATLASIGSAAVPGAGMVMLVIILGQAGIPEEGLALIVALDRILDMCRTVVNVTGDAAVAIVVEKMV